MPWKTDDIIFKTESARKNIQKFIGKRPNAEVYICTFQELCILALKELNTKGFSHKKIEFIQNYLFPSMIAKYFSLTNEIWLVDDTGLNYQTIVHELLHSIQNCVNNREDICDYLTYKLTSDLTCITTEKLKEWEEIEKSYGIDKIIKCINSKGDCEDFEL